MVTTLLVIATILSLFTILALWANRQVLNTDNWTSASSKLLESDAVRGAVSSSLVDQLYANFNVQAQLQQALPKQAKPLAGPAAGGLRTLAQDGINQLLQRPAAQRLWETANRQAHKRLVKLLEGGSGALTAQGGTVKLDLGSVLKETAQGIGVGAGLASQIPPGSAQITILRSKQLKAAQDGVEALKGLTIVLLVVTLALFITAVYISGRRREALRGVGIALIIAGVAAYLVRTFAGTAVVDALAKTDAQRPVVADVWSIGTSQLVQALVGAIAYGVVIVLGTWLAGPAPTAVRARRWLAPYLRDPRWTYGAVGLVVVLIIAWGPTPATRNLLLLLILVAFLVLGVETLRRQTAREYPEATLEGRSAARAAWFGQMRESVSGWRARHRHGGAGESGPPSPVDRMEALERLGRLRDSGVLNQTEFEAEKRRLLGTGAAAEGAG